MRVPLKKKIREQLVHFDVGMVRATVSSCEIDGARGLSTIEVGDGSGFAFGGQFDVKDYAGEFVRLIGEREACAALKPRLLEAGALAVKVEGTKGGGVQLAEDEEDLPKRDETIREAAEVVVRAMRFEDKPALSEFVDGLLSGVGL